MALTELHTCLFPRGLGVFPTRPNMSSRTALDTGFVAISEVSQDVRMFLSMISSHTWPVAPEDVVQLSSHPSGQIRGCRPDLEDLDLDGSLGERLRTHKGDLHHVIT